ncbi:MAG: tetratricopeptide repeat protein [bacterium]
MDLTAALVNEHHTRIDRYHFNTIDKARIDGHYYSDKAPGTSFLWSLPAALFFRAFRGAVNPDDVWFRYAATVSGISMLSAGTVVLMLVLLTLLCTVNRRGAETAPYSYIAITLFYSLGTLIFPYSTMFYSHALTASLALMFFDKFFRIRRAKIEPPNWLIALTGLYCGLMIITEYPSAVTVFILFAYAFLTIQKKWKIIFIILGALPFGAIILYYNQISFGNMFTTGYLHEVMPDFKAGMAQGFAGMTLPETKIFYNLLISPGRGLLWESPFLLFALPGWFYMFRRREYRLEAIVILAIIIEVIIIAASAFMPEGGMAMGPRYLIPALPFLCIPIAFVPMRRMAIKGLFAGLGVFSIALMFIATTTEPQVPRGFDHPFQQFIFKILQSGYVRENLLKPFTGNYSILILIFFCAALSFVFFRQKINTFLHKQFFITSLVAAATCAVFLVIFHLTNQTAMNESDGWQYCRLGTFYRQNDMKSDALSSYKHGIEINGDTWECHFGLGLMEFQAGSPRKAEKHFLQTLRLKPALPEAHFNMGQIYYQSGRYEQALAEYQKCADLTKGVDDDAAAKAYFFIAVIHKRTGKYEQAEVALMQAIKISPYTVERILQR